MPIFILLLSLSIVGCSPSHKSPVLARVDGETITLEDVVAKITALPETVRKAAFERRRDFINEMVDEKVLLSEAKSRGLDKEPDVQQLIDAARDKILTAKLVELEIDRKITLTVDDIKSYYQAHPEEFTTPLKFRALHILVKTPEAAKLVKAELAAKVDFKDVARKYSVDRTASAGGDIGYVQKGQLIPEIENVLMTIRIGDVIGPIETKLGSHWVKLTERVEPKLQDLESVQKLAAQRYALRKKRELLDTYLKQLKSGAKIEVQEKELAAITQQDMSSRKTANV